MKIFLLSLALFVLPLSATVIIQKNGDVISGKIIEEKAEKYVFESPYGTLQIPKSNVAKLIMDEKTIELKNVVVESKNVKARLIAQDKNTSTYLTEDGRTIKQKVAEPKANESNKEMPRDKILIALSGYYGFSTFQQVATTSAGNGQPPLEQSLHSGTFGFHLTGHYALWRFLGFGLNASYNRWSGSASQTPPPPLVNYDAQTSNTSLFFAPSVVVSLLGNLGSQQSAHDLRLELQPGISFNSADMQLKFTQGAGFPDTASASGSNRAIAAQAQLYYCYSFSESFRLRLGVGYYRVFYKNIYETTLQSASPIPGAPGGFKGDFETNLGNAGANPQIISLVIGFETGF